MTDLLSRALNVPRTAMTLAHSLRTLALVPALALGLGANATALAAPEIQHWTASTGARVHFVETRDLPMVDIQVSFAAGSALDPASKEGLASMTQALLDAGAGSLDEQTIADRKADLGIEVSGGTDQDRSSLSLRSLSSAAELDAAVALVATLLAEPGFPQPVLERERSRAVAGLREALTKPDTLAARQLTAALYAEQCLRKAGVLSTHAASLGILVEGGAAAPMLSCEMHMLTKPDGTLFE